MQAINKTSLLIPSQLPEFIRDNPDYGNFVLFLQAYYEWMEQQGGAVYESKSLPSYYDIDTTLDEFLKYYENDFLSFFPEGSLVDERKLIKVAKELYQAKGTPASYQFLFRVLYNSDVNLYNSSDYILRASDGKWIVTRSLKLATTDPTWLQTVNYRIFGETSKGYATIERVIPGLNSIEVVLSGIDRNFTSGEYVQVQDIHGLPILFNGHLLRGQIIGLLSSVAVDPVHPGSGYNAGDPVVFYGGLNPLIENAIPAEGYISQVTSSSITAVTPIYYGQGYRPGSFTKVNINSGSGLGNGAIDIATTFDPTPYYITFINTDTIGPKANTQVGDGAHLVSYNFANLTSANYNTVIAEALTFPVLTTYGIYDTTVTSGGSGYDITTSANATGYYLTDTNDLQPIPSLGILGPVQIHNGGINYQLNDKIVFSGGTGYGAYANVTAITANGSISEISYVYDPAHHNLYPLGGMGHNSHQLPTLNVTSSTGSGASLYLPGLVGDDATFKISSTSYGQVQQITLTNPGQNYVGEPSVSLRVEDMLVYNVDIFNEPKKGDVIYQGTIFNQTFTASVDSIKINTANVANTLFSTYDLRTYNYNGLLDANADIRVLRTGADIGTSIRIANTTTGIYTNGRRIYGNGAAQAKANFLNGIILSKGIYQNGDGQPSAYSVLENENYNNYTYILQVQEALAKYKQTALSFLHPSGMNYNAYNLLKNKESFHTGITEEELSIQSMAYLLNTASYLATSNSSASNTIVSFANTAGANIANVVTANSFLTIYPDRGAPFYSMITGVSLDTITLADSWNIIVPNVVVASVSSGSDVINISSLTNAWNIATGNTASYISDFLHIYDSVSFDGINFKMITHVDQPGTGTSIFVDSVYPVAQSGYLILQSNVASSNVWVSSY